MASKKKAPNQIIKVDKPGWTIFFHCGARFPVCVVETFYGSLPSAPIKRSEMGEPFKADIALPKNCRMYWREYEDYMTFGGSPGHNAPAGFHKTDETEYRRTFLLSNICPQEIVFNSGRWFLLEALCKEIVAAFRRVDILTGSLLGSEKRFGDSVIHVPSKMYKIIIATNTGGAKFIGAFLMPNKPATDEVPIEKFYVPVRYLAKALSVSTGFNVVPLLGRLGALNAECLSKVHALNPVMTRDIKSQMANSRMYGKIIYSRTMEDLERVFGGLKDPSKHQTLFYERAKKRLASEAKR